MNTTGGVSWYKRAGIWVGIGINPGSLTLGGGLASHLSLSALLFLMPLGALALTALAVSQGIVSRRRREPFAQRAASTFRSGFGSGLLNVIMALGVVGWGSFHVGIAGFSLAHLLNLPGWAGALVVASTILVLNEMGLNRWNFLVWITTLSALGAAIVALIAVGAKPSLNTSSDLGLSLPELLWVTGSVIAYGILFAVRCSDFTWDLDADADVVKAGLSLLIPLLISLGIGAALYQATGDWNLADILAQTHLAVLGHLFLILSIASPSLSGLHSGILAVQSVTPLSKRQSAGFICAVNFMLGAIRFDHQLLFFLDFLGAVLPPAMVVLLTAALLPQKVPKSAALTAWLAGAVVALLFKLQGQLIHLAVGALVSLAVLQIMMRLSSNLELSDA